MSSFEERFKFKKKKKGRKSKLFFLRWKRIERGGKKKREKKII